MPLDRLSEEDRSKLAQLIQGPVIPLPTPPAPPPHWNWRAAVHRIANRYAHWRTWIAGGAAGIACVILLIAAVQIAVRNRSDALDLQVRDLQGKLQLHWDPDSDQVRYAKEGTLFITDGAEKLFVTLDPSHLRRGRVTYARQTERVEFRMALKQPNGQVVEQKAVFFGTPVDREKTHLEAAASPEPSAAPTPVASLAVPVAVAPPRDPTGHRSRRKPLMLTGTNLPFTCSTGDTFRKTDAPSGWDTFTCRGNNVWSISRTQQEEGRHTHPPNASSITVKSASASTT